MRLVKQSRSANTFHLSSRQREKESKQIFELRWLVKNRFGCLAAAGAIDSLALVPLVVRSVWQDPFVEVIKYGMTHRSIGYYIHGDVEQVQDRVIAKSVYRIRGSVAATNYLRVPRYDVMRTLRLQPAIRTHMNAIDKEL